MHGRDLSLTSTASYTKQLWMIELRLHSSWPHVRYLGNMEVKDIAIHIS